MSIFEYTGDVGVGVLLQYALAILSIIALIVSAGAALGDKNFWQRYLQIFKRREVYPTPTYRIVDEKNASSENGETLKNQDTQTITKILTEEELDALISKRAARLSRRMAPHMPKDFAREALIKSFTEAHSTLKPQDALDLYQKFVDQDERSREREELRFTTDMQLQSTSNVKGRMISLFVMFNIGIVIGFIYVPTFVAIGKDLILGLYISLATFIVYVYRASNARALVLLAIKEDLKRYHDAERYLANRGNAAPTERDIEALKLILINRSEREKNSEHPYELALKGISNSTILFKGGKVANLSKQHRDKDL